MKRIAYIDSIKGFAILLVVMGHTFHDFKGINMAFIDFIYAFHMPLFFIISGYLGYKKDYDINQSLFYLRNKAIGLIIPFLFLGSIYTLIYNYDYILLFTDSMKMGYWFTFSLFLIFCLYYIVEIIYSSLKNIRNQNFTYIILLLIPYICLEYTRIYNYLSPEIYNLIGGQNLRVYYFYFIVGILIKKYNCWAYLFSNKYLYAISILIFSVCFYTRHSNYSNYLTLIMLGTTGSFITTYFFYNNFNRIPFNNIFVNLGEKSLDIYVLHYFFLIRIPQSPILLQDSFTSQLLSNNIEIQIFVSLILSCITISVSYIISRIIRENSLLSLISLGIKRNYLSIKSYGNKG